MANVIAPSQWQLGINDNRLLPGRYTTNVFTGKGVNIANNTEGPNAATHVVDIMVSDYITFYDDRRINGLPYQTGTEGTTVSNQDGRDGWGASAYGVFQEVRFDHRVYSMGRHRSMALRVFDEQQYSGDIGNYGTSTTSAAKGGGQNTLMKTAQIISEAKSLWEKQTLGPDIDKYNLFCACNGHINGLWLPSSDYRDVAMVPDASTGSWIAQPGEIEGQSFPPSFAPIHCIQWDENNIPMMLNTLKVTWNNMYIPEDQRVILVDPMYEYALLSQLTGGGVPATDSAYTDMQNGSFVRLMGWEFNFEIPSSYWPKIYVDANLNVVHSSTGTEAYDAYINSVDGKVDGKVDYNTLYRQLVEGTRTTTTNFVRKVWDSENKKFVTKIINYPLGTPGSVTDYYGEDYFQAKTVSENPTSAPSGIGTHSSLENVHGYGYGLSAKGSGLANAATGPQGTIGLQQVIGLALYKPSVQLSQEFSSMVTAEGGTRGKFTEVVTDVKYDAWVIERYSAGIIPILAPLNQPTLPVPVPVKVVSTVDTDTTVSGTVTTQSGSDS